MTLKKMFRLLFSLFSFGGQVKGHECIARKEVQERGGLASLSGPSQQDHRPRPHRASQPDFHIAQNPHMQNIRWNRIFCTVSELCIKVATLLAHSAQNAMKLPPKRG